MLKIYIVDDEELIVEELRNLIPYQDYGYEVCGYTTDPIIAKQEIIALKPQLVICDVAMGKITGFHLFDAIRTIQPNIKFCFLSAYDNFEYVQEAVRLGAIRYLKKPIRIQELVNLLEEIKTLIANEFNNRVFSSLVNHSFDENDMVLEKLFRNNPNLPIGTTNRIVVFNGEEAPKSDITSIAKSVDRLYEDENMVIYLVGDIDLNLLEEYSENNRLSCGVSQDFFNYEKISKHLRMARIASKQRFITGKNSFTIYAPNRNVETVISEIDKSRSTYELHTVIKNLKNLIIDNDIKAYDLQKIYRNSVFNMNKFGIIGYDEKLADLSILDYYNNLDEMISDLLGNFEEKSEIDETGTIIGDVIRELEQNVDKRLTLSYFANKYNYNSSYFSQLFKKICGCSFAEYFINLKMNKAKLLITSTDMSLTHIALEVGYDDYYHFSKMFKKYTGQSPTDYRDFSIKKHI